MPINTRDHVPVDWNLDDRNYRPAHCAWKGPAGEAAVVDKVLLGVLSWVWGVGWVCYGALYWGLLTPWCGYGS